MAPLFVRLASMFAEQSRQPNCRRGAVQEVKELNVQRQRTHKPGTPETTMMKENNE